ncbi:nuclease [Verticiella sediminum]|uniref:Nuclease n=1 Tax=Verticiella sediminum TaxID=1247510 RepID=A0A556A7L4_9BURK|nr:thermonuclease family protein [Verticiella sediminum]TSH88884.1 nuclease [Verticiella sediminum]
MTAAVAAAIVLGLAVWHEWPAPLPEPAATAGGAHTLRGRVVRVTDGDTLRLQGDGRRPYTVRLASIDAPETQAKDRRGQPYAQASRRALEALVGGRDVQAECYEIDTYGRDVCDIRLQDAGTANQAMARAGMAWANRQFGGRYLRDPAVAEAEAEARAARRGLWAEPDAVAPWVWRQRCWREGQCGPS